MKTIYLVNTYIWDLHENDYGNYNYYFSTLDKAEEFRKKMLAHYEIKDSKINGVSIMKIELDQGINTMINNISTKL